jgi:hypothetical protein
VVSIEDIESAFKRYRSPFTITRAEHDDSVVIMRQADGVSFAIPAGRIRAVGVLGLADVLYGPFRDYDAAQATPSHWMAL